MRDRIRCFILSSQNSFTKNIESLNELAEALMEGERSTYSQIIRAVDVHKLDLDEVISWSDECYTRNCVAQGDDFELILLCWEKGQASPIHDHGGEECWVKVIDGEFRETLYKKDENDNLKVTKTIQSSVGDVTYMVDFMGYHRLENLSNTRSLSLHLYANPIRCCNVYNEVSNEFVMKELSYDTVTELVSH